MVLVSSKKYACQTCIKGHRSSACKHTERPLFEIKKKGRPVTQCEHCRELRKTKQVHVKCLCESKEEGVALMAPDASGKKKKGFRFFSGGNKLSESAAFPNGLSGALEASVAVQLPSDGSSDSDHSADVGCCCKDGGDCHCCTPRRTAPRHRRKDARNPAHIADDIAVDANAVDSKFKSSSLTSSNVPISSHILARIAELRPVLPRPPTIAGPIHDPSSGIAHGSGVRHHTHENMYFSPYGRAYGYVHAADRTSYDRSARDDQPLDDAQRPAVLSSMESNGNETIQQALQTEWPTDGTFPSMCGCGDDCACPGCKEHNGSADNGGVFAPCVNPGQCTTCLDCTISSYALSLTLPTYESIDEWLRQLEALPSSGESQSPSQTQAQAPWDALQLPSIPDRASEGSCGSDCQCPPGLCTCHRQQLTFAVSGERGCESPATTGQGGDTAVRGKQNHFLGVPVAENCRSRSDSPSSQPSRVSTALCQVDLRQRPASLSSTSSLVVPTSGSGSCCTSTNSRPKSQAADTNQVVYALSNPGSEPPPPTSAYANSNPDSEHSLDDFEYRQPSGVYAMSNPDSELSHEEFEYDPRFDYGPSLIGAGDGAGPSCEGENGYPISNPDSEVSLQGFAYDPSFDGMQLY